MNAPVAAFPREQRARFFEGLSASEIRAVLAAGIQQRFSANTVIVSQGYPAEHLYLLLTGRARRFFLTEDGQKVVLLRVPPREIFGEAVLLARPVEYLLGAETTISSSTLAWNRSTIRRLCAQIPRLMDNALLISFDYMAAYRAAHASLVCNSASERLTQVLTNLAEGIGQKVPGGIELDVRNEELANEANISLFTVSRLLSAWQRDGFLVKRRGKVLLRFPGPLVRHGITALQDGLGVAGQDF